MQLSVRTGSLRIMCIMNKGMRALFRFFIMLCAVLTAFASCGAPADTDVEVVPDGVLKIFADKTDIAADGSDCVTFSVMFGSEDVSILSVSVTERLKIWRQVPMSSVPYLQVCISSRLAFTQVENMFQRTR